MINKGILSLLLTSSLPILLTGCTGGKPLATIKFGENDLEPRTTQIALVPGKSLSFWNSIDVEYIQPIELKFLIDIKQGNNGVPVRVSCDALNPTTTFMSREAQFQDKISKSWKLAKMQCGYGPITKASSLNITVQPLVSKPVKIKRFELQIKS